MIKELTTAKSPASAMNLVIKEGFSYIAGGTEINRLNSDARVQKAVSIRKLPFDSIEKLECEHDGEKHEKLRIGSLCTFEQCIISDDVPEDLKIALKYNSSLQKRNMATIGGNIAAARDDSYLIPTLAALNAKVVLFKHEEPVAIMEYLKKRSKGDLIEAILVPLCKRRAFSYRISNTQASHAIVTVAMGCCGDPGDFKLPIAVAAIKGYGIVELKGVEKEMSSSGKNKQKKLRDTVMGAKINLKDDLVYGSAEFRKYELGASVYLIAENLKNVFEG